MCMGFEPGLWIHFPDSEVPTINRCCRKFLMCLGVSVGQGVGSLSSREEASQCGIQQPENGFWTKVWKRESLQEVME